MAKAYKLCTTSTSNHPTNLQVEVNDVFLLMFLIVTRKASKRRNAGIQITQNQLNIFMFQYLSGNNMHKEQPCLFSISWLFKLHFNEMLERWNVLCYWNENKLKSIWKAKSVFDLFQFLDTKKKSFESQNSFRYLKWNGNL